MFTIMSESCNPVIENPIFPAPSPSFYGVALAGEFFLPPDERAFRAALGTLPTTLEAYFFNEKKTLLDPMGAHGLV